MPTFRYLSKSEEWKVGVNPPFPLPEWPFWTLAQPYSACLDKRGTGGGYDDFVKFRDFASNEISCGCMSATSGFLKGRSAP